MYNPKFYVSVKQKTNSSYFDGAGKKIEYESENEICGKFIDWTKVEDFIEIVMGNFDDAVITIKIIDENKDGE